MKFTAVKLISFWNAVGDFHAACGDSVNPVITAWMKRFIILAECERNYWNTLTKEEREVIKDVEISIPIEPIPVGHEPKWHPPQLTEKLQPMFEGELSPPKTQLEQKLKPPKNDKAKEK